MAAEDSEEKVLRSVALKNAGSILRARQRAERELIDGYQNPVGCRLQRRAHHR